MQYARGLAARGHAVSVIPNAPSDTPRWVEGKFDLVTGTAEEFDRCRKELLAGRLGRFVASRISRAARKRFRRDMELDAAVRYLRARLPPADATVAATLDAAFQVARCGTGRRCYFMQHFDPYFADAEQAEGLFGLDLLFVVNSSWLRGKVAAAAPAAHVALCPNAIDHAVFRGEPKRRTSAKEVTVISYGGRDAEWKGFREMAEAVRLVRSWLPGVNLRWVVYGDAILPPDNGVAPYEGLGFLGPQQLAKAYRSADILLSASWYESFPLFPLEAMASGLPVVTTPLGTEEYAVPGVTAEVVEARNPRSIAEGLARLVADPEYAFRIAAAGHAMSQRFTWPSAVERMERLLLGEPDTALS